MPQGKVVSQRHEIGLARLMGQKFRKDNFYMKTQLASKATNSAKRGKYLAILIAAISATVICLGLLMSVNTSGNSILPESRDIFTLYDTYNMTVVVVFDEEPPIVQFIAPDGSAVVMENIRYRPGSNFVQFFLPNAMPGVWRMDYDPLTNSEITTPYSVYMSHIFIRDFTAMMARDEAENIPVTFEVSADEPGEFRYEVHAIFTDLDNSIVEQFLLVKGYGMLNETLNLGLNTDAIQGMGGFMLRLTAYVQYGQASVQDTAWLDLRLSWES